MARPKKNNADYFTHDADMRNDVKIKAIRRRFGHAGYAAWNYLLEVMTDSDYFELDWSELNQELLSADFDIPVEELCQIVEYCVRLGLFKLDGGKIISEALQRRFSGLLSKRKRDTNRNSDTENKSPDDLPEECDELSPAETPNQKVIDDENPQSKVKESKVNIILSDNDSDTHPDGCSSDPPGESKKLSGKKKSTAKRFIPPTVQQVEEYCRERGNRVSPVRFIDYYTSNGWKVGKNPMMDWKAAVRTWENNDYDNANKKATTNSNGVDCTSANERRYGSTAGAKQSITDRIARLSGQTAENVPDGGETDSGDVGRLPLTKADKP